MDITKEQKELAMNCKSLEEFKELAKKEGLSFSDDEAEFFFKATRVGKLSDDDLDAVAGGKGGNKVVCGAIIDFKCPFCSTYIDGLCAETFENGGDRTSPDTCPGCGAKIRAYAGTVNAEFSKDGETKFTSCIRYTRY